MYESYKSHVFKAADTEVLFVKCQRSLDILNIALSTQLNCKIVMIYQCVSYSKMF